MELTDRERRAIIERYPISNGKEKKSFSPSEQASSPKEDMVGASSEVSDSGQSLLDLMGESLKNRQKMDDEEDDTASEIREKLCENIRTDLIEGLL